MKIFIDGSLSTQLSLYLAHYEEDIISGNYNIENVDQKGEKLMDFQLEGKVALVTGASRGIGRGTAKILSTENCKVAICASEKSYSKNVDEIENAGSERPLVIAKMFYLLMLQKK